MIDDNEGYYDEVGGFHDPPVGYNPNGVYCGECSFTSCKGCTSEHLIYNDDNEKIM